MGNCVFFLLLVGSVNHIISNYWSFGFLRKETAGKDQVLMARGACLIPFGLAVSGGWGRSSPV